MPGELDILLVTNFGLESVATGELAALGYHGKGHATGRVLFKGDARAIARANLHLRTVDRVLIRVATFPARDFDALFEGVKALPWEQWIPRDFAFPVDGRSVKSQLSSVPACQRTVKKAIVERLLRAHATPSLPETGPTVRVEIALWHDQATLTIDTTGPGLHKRGYRTAPGAAALKETLAAGLVLLSVWKPQRPLIDPFCGSGTIAIEAALWARNIAPGLLRSFDAERWPSFGERVWAEAREEARAAPRGELAHAIHAYDIDADALALARRAAEAAGVSRDVHFKQQPFDALASKAEYGSIITNPPYGVRLGDADEIDHLYRSMPLVFRRLPTWSIHMLTGRLDLEDIFGQRASRRRKFYNSTIETWYFTFLGPKPPGLRAFADTPETNAEEDGGERAENGTAGEERDAGDAAAETPAPDDDVLQSPSVPHSSPVASSPTSPPDAPLGLPVHSESASRTSRAASPAFGGLRERDERELADFGACLAKNVRHLRRYPSRGVTCYRVYERDQVDVPLIIDVYEGRAHVAEYEREHSRTLAQQADWWDRVRAIVAGALGIDPAQVYTKQKHRQRGLTQHEKQSATGETITVREGGLAFEVNLRDYIDTGLFLDHRLTRQMVREQSRGVRFLNLFCYTGAFTVYAAAGGAASTTSVDLSNTYLDWTQRNLRLNGLWNASHRLVRSDTLSFLRTHPAGEHYDLAVIDPPTFSNSTSTEEDWEVLHGHTEVLTRTLALMPPGGVVYFSTNFRRFKLDEAALAGVGASSREISARTVPPEYRNRRIHRCWRIVAGGGGASGAPGGPASYTAGS
ncbi:MAG: bifunctional 23S rRNA (guanine(2069)-N(7))-methyltransferase RlmK/23S rRNA (guanine(2445)-N(2))-methyltransferase RlmL [Planctomycetota bacterium]|nr:bifunctional 23S rRNA (guanine(2069)-N(7))-methyltransferase RlmK/23S rRNA (guanine(2445)-N(2))-methyltransferase RlmL [Planctomycetota bacterium]